LVTLTIENCQFLSDVMLPFYLLPLLPKLETLVVENCDSVKTIFDVKYITKDTLVLGGSPRHQVQLHENFQCIEQNR